MHYRRATAATALAGIALSLHAPLAHAGEISYDTHYVYSSKITDFRTKSPFSWRDDGSLSGTWISFSGCHFNDGYAGNPEPTLTLRRERNGIPDESRGAGTLSNCRTRGSGNWGNQPVGTYHYTVTDFDTVVNTSQLHVNSVKVSF